MVKTYKDKEELIYRKKEKKKESFTLEYEADNVRTNQTNLVFQHKQRPGFCSS